MLSSLPACRDPIIIIIIIIIIFACRDPISQKLCWMVAATARRLGDQVRELTTYLRR